MAKDNISKLKEDIVFLPPRYFRTGAVIIILSGVIFFTVSRLIRYRDFYSLDTFIRIKGSDKIVVTSLPDEFAGNLSKNQRLNIKLFLSGRAIKSQARITSFNGDSICLSWPPEYRSADLRVAGNKDAYANLSFWGEEKSILERIFKNNTLVLKNKR